MNLGKTALSLYSLTILFCLLFFATLHFNCPFTLQLVAWFGVCLCGFHTLFFILRLTTTWAKKLDYLYLGITVIGVFLFALGYADQRQLLLNQFGIR